MGRLLFTRAFIALLIPALWASDPQTRAANPVVLATSSTWVSVGAPFTGDDNNNGHTTFEISASSAGPFDTPIVVAGYSDWRVAVFSGLTPGASYFIRITHTDVDGVTGPGGPGPRVLGPVTTESVPVNSVLVGPVAASAGDAEISVVVPIRGDANQNSRGIVEIATSPVGPWESRVRSMSYAPKQARIRSLNPNTDYYVRVTVQDSDGVQVENGVAFTGTTPNNAVQMIGPIHYAGAKNLAFGQRIAADEGWGCCPNPSELVDGIIQTDDWPFGYAWTGGTGHWGNPGSHNILEGTKQATIDFGSPLTFNRALVWLHDSLSVPASWSFQHSADAVTWQRDYVNTAPICRTDTPVVQNGWYFPACAHDGILPAPITARYFRYEFDDTTTFNGLHGWASEIEVLDTTNVAKATLSPASLDFGQIVIGARTAPPASLTVTVSGTAVVGTPRVLALDGTDITFTKEFAITNCVQPVLGSPNCQISITFAPASIGVRQAMLVIDAAGTKRVPLKGEGLAGTVSWAGFNQTAVTFVPQPQTLNSVGAITLTNYGSSPLIINSITVVPNDPAHSAFSLDSRTACPTSPQSLSFGGACNIYVDFGSPSTGTYGARLEVHSNAANTPSFLALTGEVVQDSDGDGIPDTTELLLGSNPQHKDIFVQLGYMFSNSPCESATPGGTGHNHRPDPKALQAVIDAFAIADVVNPDGSKGITLHLDCGPNCNIHLDTGEFVNADGTPFLGSPEPPSPSSWAYFQGLKTSLFPLPSSRDGIYHYAMFAHKQAEDGPDPGINATGLAFGRDFEVTLGHTPGCNGDNLSQRGTFMHELGHTLGLLHGGDEATNNKPNYLSVMNYLFQTGGLLHNGSGALDFSGIALRDLDETSLIESQGIKRPTITGDNDPILAGYGTSYYCRDGTQKTVTDASGGIDWDCDGSVTLANTPLPFSVNINNDFAPNTTPPDPIFERSLHGFNDWSHLAFLQGVLIKQQGVALPAPMPPTFPVELTVEQDRKLAKLSRVAVIGPGDVSLPSRGKTSLTFVVTNTGTTKDSYDLIFTSTRPWITSTDVPAHILSLDPGFQLSIPLQVSGNTASGIASLEPGRQLSIPLQVSANAISVNTVGGEMAQVTLSARSQTNNRIVDVARSNITIGVADLAVSVAANTSELAGNVLPYTIKVINNGPDTAQNVTLTATLPGSALFVSATTGAGTCTGALPFVCALGEIPVGGSVMVGLSVRPGAAGTLSNSVSVSGRLVDPVQANNQATSVTTIVGEPSITIRVLQQSRNGNTLNVMVSMINQGAGPAKTVSITQIIPRTLSGTGPVVYSGPTVPITVGEIQTGSVRVVPISLKIPDGVTRLSLVESGSVTDVAGTVSAFSATQMIIP